MIARFAVTGFLGFGDIIIVCFILYDMICGVHMRKEFSVICEKALAEYNRLEKQIKR